MIEVIKMESVDERKEVLQYLKDHRDTISELATCTDEPVDGFDDMIKDIVVSLILDEIECFRQSKGNTGLSKISETVICALYDISYFNILSLVYNESIDAILVSFSGYNVATIGISTSHILISVADLKNKITKEFESVDARSLHGFYINMTKPTELPDGYPYPIEVPNQYSAFGMNATQYPYGPMGSPNPNVTQFFNHAMAQSKKDKKNVKSCNHINEDGTHALYKTDPKNKGYKCSLCQKQILKSQADKIIERCTKISGGGSDE